MNKILLFSILCIILSSCHLNESQIHKKYPLLNDSSLIISKAWDKEGLERQEFFSRGAAKIEAALKEYNLDNGYIYYNLANAWFHAGKLGKSIVNYKRALSRMPLNKNIQNNLSYARSQVLDRIELEENRSISRVLLFFHNDIPAKFKWNLLIFLVIGLFVLRIVTWTKKNKIVNKVSIGLAILSTVLFLSIIVEINEKASGVIVVTEIIGRKGDSEGYESSFNDSLKEGVEFSLISERDNWYEIELGDKRRTWIPSNAFELVD